jgi:hypothetical protein
MFEQNPERKPEGRSVGLSKGQAAEYPQESMLDIIFIHLLMSFDLEQGDFRGRSFGGENPREFLDFEGAGKTLLAMLQKMTFGSEIILIGAKEDVRNELGEPFIDLTEETEAEVDCQQMFKDSVAFQAVSGMLHLAKKQADTSLKPIFGQFC